MPAGVLVENIHKLYSFLLQIETCNLWVGCEFWPHFLAHFEPFYALNILDIFLKDKSVSCLLHATFPNSVLKSPQGLTEGKIETFFSESILYSLSHLCEC